MSYKIGDMTGKPHKQVSTPLKQQVEEFEAKLHADNIHLFKQLGLKDFKSSKQNHSSNDQTQE